MRHLPPDKEKRHLMRDISGGKESNILLNATVTMISAVGSGSIDRFERHPVIGWILHWKYHDCCAVAGAGLQCESGFQRNDWP